MGERVSASVAQAVEDQFQVALPQPRGWVAKVLDHMVGSTGKQNHVSAGDVGTKGPVLLGAADQCIDSHEQLSAEIRHRLVRICGPHEEQEIPLLLVIGDGAEKLEQRRCGVRCAKKALADGIDVADVFADDGGHQIVLAGKVPKQSSFSHTCTCSYVRHRRIQALVGKLQLRGGK